MTAAAVTLAALALLLGGALVWLARRHVLRVEAEAVRVAADDAALRDLAAERDRARAEAAQSAADLAALTALHDQTAAELATATEVLHEELSKRIITASPADVPRVAGELLSARAAAIAARRAAAAGADRGAAGDPDVPGPGAAAGAGDGAGG